MGKGEAEGRDKETKLIKNRIGKDLDIVAGTLDLLKKIDQKLTQFLRDFCRQETMALGMKISLTV